MTNRSKVMHEHTIFDAIYDFEDPLHYSIIIDAHGLSLKYEDRLGAKMQIPLAIDPFWNFRIERGFTCGIKPSTPIRELTDKLLEIANWLDKNHDKSLSEFIMIQKLSN